MTVHFFLRDSSAPTALLTVPSGVHVSCWQPSIDGLPPRRSHLLTNNFWWMLDRIGGFSNSGFAELRIEAGGSLLHRLVVTPAWYRFPFMGPGDLQIGNLWTAPEARRNQLARVAIEEAHRRFGTARRFWYVAEATNRASEALARSCGYELVAVGRRTRRFGSRLFGQYVIDRFV